MLIKFIIAALIAAGTFFFTTRMEDGSMCFFALGAQMPGFCGAPVLYYAGWLLAAGVFVWGLIGAVRRPRQPSAPEA